MSTLFGMMFLFMVAVVVVVNHIIIPYHTMQNVQAACAAQNYTGTVRTAASKQFNCTDSMGGKK